jgi:uncharacterized membrane protein
VKARLFLQKEKTNKYIIKPQNQVMPKFRNQQNQSTSRLTGYLTSSQAAWYWTVIVLVVTAVLVILFVPDDLHPWNYAKNILGILFALFFPGYTLIKALFPTKMPVKTSKKYFDTIELVALSIGLSLTLVPLVGLVLTYTSLGIGLLPMLLSLLGLTLIFATVALARDYQTKSKLGVANSESKN